MGDVALAAIYNTTVASGVWPDRRTCRADRSRRRHLQRGTGLAGTTGSDRSGARRSAGVVPDGGWSLLVDASALGMAATELSQRLLTHGRIAATPLTAWGQEVAPQYVRLVYATEPADRLRGIGERVRAAL
jgi:hypothetical protein